MGEYTAMVLGGEVCAYCGVFLKEHLGAPTMCEKCWQESTACERREYSRGEELRNVESDVRGG